MGDNIMLEFKYAGTWSSSYSGLYYINTYPKPKAKNNFNNEKAQLQAKKDTFKEELNEFE